MLIRGYVLHLLTTVVVPVVAMVCAFLMLGSVLIIEMELRNFSSLILFSVLTMPRSSLIEYTVFVRMLFIDYLRFCGSFNNLSNIWVCEWKPVRGLRWQHRFPWLRFVVSAVISLRVCLPLLLRVLCTPSSCTVPALCGVVVSYSSFF
jgi:hypothetical protein